MGKEYQVLIVFGVQTVIGLILYFSGFLSAQGEVEVRVTHIEYQIESIEKTVLRIEHSEDDLNDKVDRILLQRLGSAQIEPPVDAD